MAVNPNQILPETATSGRFAFELDGPVAVVPLLCSCWVSLRHQDILVGDGLVGDGLPSKFSITCPNHKVNYEFYIREVNHNIGLYGVSIQISGYYVNYIDPVGSQPGGTGTLR